MGRRLLSSVSSVRGLAAVTGLACLAACAGPGATPSSGAASSHDVTTSAMPATSRSAGPAPTAAGGATAGATAGTPSVRSAPGGLPRPDHVVIVVEENHALSAVVGSPDAPYITSLATAGASFTRSYGVTHPSEPNYLALFSGSTQGLGSDACPVTYTGDNLASQLRSAGLTFAGYSQGMPHDGFRGCQAGAYARKHNPWSDFTTVPSGTNRAFSSFPRDYASLPTVSFVVPDLEHDMHDGSVATGDAWLRDNLDGYVRWARSHNSLLVLTFDEADGSHANHIATVIVGAHVRPGSYSQRIDHDAVLRTVEDLYGLGHLGQAARSAPISGVWQ